MKKHSELITVILFCLTVFAFAVAFFVIPDAEYSEEEKRPLEQAPELNKEAFFSGDYAKDVNVYFSDQFPLRSLFVKIKSASELALGKSENNGVLYSYDQLAVKDFPAYNVYDEEITEKEDTDFIYFDSVKLQLESVNALADKLDVPLVTVLPPRTIDIAESRFDYERPDGDRMFDMMNGILNEKAGYIDVLSLLRPKYEQGEYVYYRTDHHWTTLGAYYVYCEIMESLGCGDSIIPKEEFDIEQIDGFVGSTASKGCFPFYKKDVIEMWHLPDDTEYEVIADGEDMGGFYVRDYIDTIDKYSLFMGGVHNTVSITKKGEDRKTLLIARDSFSDCLVPFLAREFNIVTVNLDINQDIRFYASYYEADAVLIVYNAENLIKTANLANVRLSTIH
jgi:hypothetical protein